jgi:hypothetical protein
MNKIFFITLFFIKQSRLATIQIQTKKVRFSNGPVGTRQNGPFEYRIGPVFGCSLYFNTFSASSPCKKKFLERQLQLLESISDKSRSSKTRPVYLPTVLKVKKYNNQGYSPTI